MSRPSDAPTRAAPRIAETCSGARSSSHTADAQLAAAGHPSSIYVREDQILIKVDGWLNELFEPQHREQTIGSLYEATLDPGTVARRQAMTAQLKECDGKLATYRAALEAGTDPNVVSAWIKESLGSEPIQRNQLRRLAEEPRMTRDDVVSLVDRMTDLAVALTTAEDRTRARVYQELSLRLTYRHQDKTVVAEAAQPRHGDFSVSEGRHPRWVHGQRWPLRSSWHKPC